MSESACNTAERLHHQDTKPEIALVCNHHQHLCLISVFGVPKKKAMDQEGHLAALQSPTKDDQAGAIKGGVYHSTM